MQKIRLGIVGYGNLGRGVQYAVAQNADMEIVAVFTRRDPASVHTVLPVKVEKYEAMKDYVGKIDVMILCGGSATDLPEQSAQVVRLFNTVDSFDTHAKIPAYFEALDKAAKEASHVGAMSIGWDPGLFSLARIYFGAALPAGSSYTFWGKGVSQGHSDAIRRVTGVKDARQYTVPVESALERVRGGENPAFLKLSPPPREFQTRKISPFRFRPGAKENEQKYPGKILSKPVKSASERDRKALKNAFCRAYSLYAFFPERIARISRSEILLAPGGFDKKREFPGLGPAQGPRMVRTARMIRARPAHDPK